jgi:phage shock protein PspC (stress-responsive transcriptional regulator)
MSDEQEPKPEGEGAPEPGEAAQDAETSHTDTAPQTEPVPKTEPVRQTAPAAAAARRLTRRPEGKILGGVCTGLAAFMGVDPVLVRVGFVLAAILGGGTGVIVYIVMWLVMPMAAEGEPLPPVPHSFDVSSTWRWTAIGLIILAVVLLSHNIWHFHAALFWGLVLLGVGVALWSREIGRNGHTPPRNAETTAPLPPAPPPSAPITGGGGAMTSTRPLPPAPTAPPARRPPSVLGRLVVGAAALAVGIAVLLDNLGTVHMTPRLVIAVLLFIVGIGLVVGSWWGRARWLVFPGIVLTLMLGGVALLPANIHGGAGDLSYAPTLLSDVRAQYHHGAGNLRIDLTGVKFDASPHTIRVTQGFGNLEIDLPNNVPVLARSHIRGGNLELFGHDSHGWDISDTQRSTGDNKLGLLTIRTDVGFGNTQIQRGDSSPGPNRFGVYVGPRRVKVDIP